MPIDMPRGSFADIVANASRGAINDDATSELKKLVAEMQYAQRNRHGEPKGKITLELTLELNKTGCFEITSDVKVKRPAMAKTRAFLFPRKDGSLSEEDERQTRLDLDAKDLNGASPAARDVSDHRMASANDKT